MTDAPFGVSLAVYAGVLVALGEGHDLKAVLDQEQLELDAWRAAEPTWKARLAASSARGGAEFNEFRARTIEAEDTLARRVAPVEEDLGAWLAFAKAWAASPDPAAFLSKHALRAGDVSRLRRGWDERFEAEPALAVKAARLVADGKVGPVPPLRVEPAHLVRFPWSKGYRAAPHEDPTPAAAEGDDRDARYLAAHRRARERMLAVAPRVLPPDATSPCLPAVVLQPLPFDATEPAGPLPLSAPLAPHPNVGETVEFPALSDADLLVASDPGSGQNIHATAILDAHALVDVGTPLPFPPRRA